MIYVESVLPAEAGCFQVEADSVQQMLIDALTRIAQAITSLGIEIDDEDLVHREYYRPYAPFGPLDDAVLNGRGKAY